MNLQSSTLVANDSAAARTPFHVTQAEHIHAFREAWAEAGHEREPRVSVSRSIFPLVDAHGPRVLRRPRARTRTTSATSTRRPEAIFGRSYAAEPDELIEQLRRDEAIAAADTLLLTVPNQLGVEYNAHVIEGVLKHVAPALGWR